MCDYNKITEQNKEIFKDKLSVYGLTFNKFRDISLIEQIEMKLNRIVKIQSGDDMLVNDIGDDIISEYVGVYNYVIQYFLRDSNCITSCLLKYDNVLTDIRELKEKKDVDYGSLWKELHLWTLTDLMLVKLSRIKNMILSEMRGNDIDYSVTEGVESNLYDLANYSIFCIIKTKRKN